MECRGNVICVNWVAASARPCIVWDLKSFPIIIHYLSGGARFCHSFFERQETERRTLAPTIPSTRCWWLRQENLLIKFLGVIYVKCIYVWVKLVSMVAIEQYRSRTREHQLSVAYRTSLIGGVWYSGEKKNPSSKEVYCDRWYGHHRVELRPCPAERPHQPLQTNTIKRH